jgi:hypothetical protein
MENKPKFRVKAYKWRKITPDDKDYAIIIDKINQSPYFQEQYRKAVEFLKKHPIPERLLK